MNVARQENKWILCKVASYFLFVCVWTRKNPFVTQISAIIQAIKCLTVLRFTHIAYTITQIIEHIKFKTCRRSSSAKIKSTPYENKKYSNTNDTSNNSANIQLVNIMKIRSVWIFTAYAIKIDGLNVYCTEVSKWTSQKLTFCISKPTFLGVQSIKSTAWLWKETKRIAIT